MQLLYKITLLFTSVFFFTFCSAQTDTTLAPKNITVKKNAPTDKVKPAFSPRKAAIKSAIVPGLGQIYNKKYWKLPLVYGALGTTAGVFIYNVKTYKKLRTAYTLKADDNPDNDILIDPKFRNISAQSLKSYRNVFRQNVDYSVLFFIIFWGLNVVDASVDAHLKSFDVNDNLSLQIVPGYSPVANTSGVSLVFNVSKNKPKIVTSLP